MYYAFRGELFLFFLSTLVALQHECAHAFAAAKLGYKLNRIVLMPFGAVIDGDLKNVSLKDEILVALWGPLCNLLTAIFFVALWWFAPTMYAFTDTACYSSLSIALVNLLPAYPLDGGRILQCALAKLFQSKTAREDLAERKARRVCKTLTLSLSLVLLLLFVLKQMDGEGNFSLLTFSLFLLFGGLGGKNTAYEKLSFSYFPDLKRGVELRRVAISAACPVKDAIRFFAKGYYLVFEVYEGEKHLFDLSQNQFNDLFSLSRTPYESLSVLWDRQNQAKY